MQHFSKFPVKVTIHPTFESGTAIAIPCYFVLMPIHWWCFLVHQRTYIGTPDPMVFWCIKSVHGHILQACKRVALILISPKCAWRHVLYRWLCQMFCYHIHILSILNDDQIQEIVLNYFYWYFLRSYSSDYIQIIQNH